MMKKIITLIFLISCFTMMSSNANNDPLSKLEGTWYVNMSNFSMWLKGNKHNPRFTYTLQTKQHIEGLKDVVNYDKNDKQKRIIGFDKPLNTNITSFIWRGKGLLAPFKSKWEILYQTDSWALIHFQKTIVTAEGYDVISRQKSLDAATIALIKLKLNELGIKDNLQSIAQK